MTTAYRFLPWSRQGLASRIATPDTLAADMEAHTRFPVRVRVNDGAPVGVDVSLYGPGDIVGVDPRGIVRTDPSRYATDVEPNYMAGIEFDRPDFPWMFTPAGPGVSDRLRPWCVLVVVELKDDIAIRTDRTRPLPFVSVGLSELPPLTESWAWAHTQALTEEASTSAVVDNLTNQANLNVSRILCPRRLVPGTRYLACLVPAFLAGVQAGLGLPVAETSLAPAWTAPSGGQASLVELPVYHHWEFATGPGGDFESLARRLQPATAPAGIGVSRVSIARADPALPELTGEDAIVAVEGALIGPDIELEEPLGGLPDRWFDALGDILSAPARTLAGSEDGDSPVAPPLYAEWPTGVHVLTATVPRWMRELNLDPRLRTIAGLATQVVRANQEELVHDAWRQVGNVETANRFLELARFSQQAAIRLHRRVFQPLSGEQVFLLTAPLHAGVAMGGASVRGRLHGSVLPDATADPAFRRLAAPGGRIVRRAMRLTAQQPSPSSVISSIIGRLDAGTLPAEPTGAVPDGLDRSAALKLVDTSGDGPVDLTPIGGRRSIDVAVLRAVKTKADNIGTIPLPTKVLLRKDLSKSGIVVRTKIDVVIGTDASTGTLDPAAVDDPAAIPRDRIPTDEIPPGRLPPDRLPDDRVPPGRIPPDRTPPGKIPPRRPPVSKDKAALSRLTAAFNAHVATLVEIPEPPVAPPLGLDVVRGAVLSGTDPDTVVPTRVAAMVRIEQPGGDARLPTPLIVSNVARSGVRVGRIVASPQLERPMYEPLATFAPERLLPGIGDVAPNTVTLVRTNPRFVESFLVGANTEMAAELAWREYPGRRDGSPLRRFWDRTDGAADIPDIRAFDATVGIGRSVRGGSVRGGSANGGADSEVVLLVRGDLLRRYPSAVVYAVRATGNERLSQNAADHHQPVFTGRIDPDITFIGFDLGLDEVLASPGFFFVIQQQPTEPRFGFDSPADAEGSEPASRPATWRDATWDHVGVAPGGHLTVAGADVTLPTDTGGATFVTNAAHLAAIALQQPVRVAIHARNLLAGGDG